MGHAFYFAMALLLGFAICAAIVGIIAPVSYNQQGTWTLWQAWYNGNSIDPNKVAGGCALDTPRVCSILALVMAVASALCVGLRLRDFASIWTVASLFALTGLSIASAVTSSNFQSCVTSNLGGVNPLGPLWNPPGPAMIAYIVCSIIGFVCVLALGFHACWASIEEQERKQEEEKKQLQLQRQQAHQARKAAEQDAHAIPLGELFSAKQKQQQQQYRRQQNSADDYQQQQRSRRDRYEADPRLRPSEDVLLPLREDDGTDDDDGALPSRRSPRQLSPAALSGDRRASRRDDLAVAPDPYGPPMPAYDSAAQYGSAPDLARRTSRLQQLLEFPEHSPRSPGGQQYGRDEYSDFDRMRQKRQSSLTNSGRAASSPRLQDDVDDPFAPYLPPPQQRYDRQPR